MLTNHDDGAAVQRALQAEVLRSTLDVHPHEQTRLELPSQELRKYAGKYESPLWTAKITVDESELMLQVIPRGGFPEPSSPPPPGPPPTRLAFCDKDAVIALDPPLKGDGSEFRRDADDEISWYRFNGRFASTDRSKTDSSMRSKRQGEACT